MASEAALTAWREFFAQPQNSTRPDALARAMKGVLPADEGDVLSDPMWLPIEQSERRKSVMAQVEAFESSSLPCGFHNWRVTVDGESYPASEFVEWQSRTAYACIAKGLDNRTIAALIHRDPQWVEEEVRQKFFQ